jgi:tripartite-type tricarboxylate transporter receptor subunit TctC
LSVLRGMERILKGNPTVVFEVSQATTEFERAQEVMDFFACAWIFPGIDFVHVPYRGPLIPDLLAGQVQLYFSPTPQALPYVKDGRLRALGVTSAKRSAALPDVPAIAEFVPGYAASAWVGIGAPKGTPAEIIRQLNTEIGAVLADPEAQSRLLALGFEPHAMRPAEFKTFIAAEVDKWEKVIAFAHIQPN